MRRNRLTASLAEYMVLPFMVTEKTCEKGALRSTCSWEGGNLMEVDTVAVTSSSVAEVVRRRVRVSRAQSLISSGTAQD